jgi:hypothetical protein
MSKPISRIRTKGRGKTRPFVMFDRDMLRSSQWAQLSTYAVKLIIDLAAQYNGSNNGDLCATWSVMRKQGWRSPSTLNRAKCELSDKGWLDLTRLGGLHKASLYALTIWGINECGGKLDIRANPVPSHRWKINIGSPDVYQSSPDVYQSQDSMIKKAA